MRGVWKAMPASENSRYMSLTAMLEPETAEWRIAPLVITDGTA
jgi:hypothetical protein